MREVRTRRWALWRAMTMNIRLMVNDTAYGGRGWARRPVLLSCRARASTPGTTHSNEGTCTPPQRSNNLK